MENQIMCSESVTKLAKALREIFKAKGRGEKKTARFL